MFSQNLSRFMVALAVFLAGVSWVRAAEIMDAPRVEGLSGTTATVRWATDVVTGTRVHYGLSANQLMKSAEGENGMFHNVTINGLQPGTAYCFAVGTARKILATGQFTTVSSAASASAPVSSSPLAAARAAIGRLFEDSSKSTRNAPASTPAPASVRVPPASVTWGNPGSLADHFARHGGDFHASSAEDYAAQAWQFRQRARTGALRVKLDDDGVQRVFDPATGAFAAYNRDGTTKTFFKPGSPGYFERQPGRPVKAITP